MKTMLLNALGFSGQDDVNVRLAVPAIWAEGKASGAELTKKELKKLYQADLESFLNETEQPAPLA